MLACFADGAAGAAPLADGPVTAAALQWSQLAPLPDQLGVAGAFAGVSDGALIVAGGANFPDKMPWDGGKKVWHYSVYSLSETNGAWRNAGRLPRALAYGVSVTLNGAVFCAGGSDSERHYPDTFQLHHRLGRIETQPVGALPIPLANAAGAVVSNVVYVVGGSEAPGEQSASRRCFALGFDWKALEWREIKPLPGKARILPVAGALEGAFYVLGGAALEPVDGKVKRVYLRDAWRYRPGPGWQRLPDLPKPCVAAPSPAPTSGGRLWLLGGDDGSVVGLQSPSAHPGFPKSALVFEAAREGWQVLDQVLPVSRATAPAVEWQGRFVMPSGEVRPGVRSPEVWAVRLGK